MLDTHLRDGLPDLFILYMCCGWQMMPQAEARLTAGDPVKNARALLRYALPIKNDSARRIQARFPIATVVGSSARSLERLGMLWS